MPFEVRGRYPASVAPAASRVCELGRCIRTAGPAATAAPLTVSCCASHHTANSGEGASVPPPPRALL